MNGSPPTKARVESAKRCDKRYTVREVNHIFDIVNTFFYIAPIPAGWSCLGGENVGSALIPSRAGGQRELIAGKAE